MGAGLRPRVVPPLREAILAIRSPEIPLVLPSEEPDPDWPDWARATLGAVLGAVSLVQEGAADALVTAPLCKEELWRLGFPHPGHTELLSQLAGDPPVGMLYWSPRLVVELATRHIPLRQVPDALDPALLLEQIRLTAAALPLLDRPLGRIAVCGLNPHAGEGGRLGDEEERIVRPAVEQARALGLDVQGPRPPDTVFWEALAGAFDAVVALYHDQGSIPLKTVAFREGVNVTLGLPWIRTSVDHGTAFELAGRGLADPTSCLNAIRLARRMAERKRHV